MSTLSMWRGSRRWLGCALSLGLAACRTTPAPPPLAETSAAPPAPISIPAGAQPFRVVAEQSLLQILVYRGGPMARLGHNHLIASHHLDGVVHVTGDPLETRFDIHFPVAQLTVDEPALRAGADFPPEVPHSARDGTRRNLLSEALLDAERYPDIRLRATDVRASGDGYDIGIELTLKDARYALRVPASVVREPGALTASGEFPLWQSQLGLEPFSIAMGSLVVLDEMRIRFRITARQQRKWGQTPFPTTS